MGCSAKVSSIARRLPAGSPRNADPSQRPAEAFPQFKRGNGFGTSDNILGPSNQIARVITPHVPAGIALLADFRELALFMRHSIRIDVATQGNPTGAEYDLFESNAFVIRTEVPMGVGVLRPQAFCVVALPGGS